MHAIDFIANALNDFAGELTLVATGPLTNVALLLARYPEIGPRFERIVLMGGALAEGNTTPAAEFNIWVDPEAAHRVFTSGIELTMVGLNVTHRALMDPAHARGLAGTGIAGQLVADLFGFFAEFHQRAYGWDGVPIHDAVAIAHVIDATLLDTRHCGVVIDTGSELSRGRTHVDLWGLAGWTPNCHVAVNIDADRFLKLLTDRISALC
jgi:inosine-uridine nucleoside N-ribohydrolase